MGILSSFQSYTDENTPNSKNLRFGWLANACTLGSLLMCFANTVLIVVLGVFSVRVTELVPHVQAVLMWLLALLAVVGLVLDRKQHRNIKPIAVGILSLVAMIGTLYGYYHWAILTLAYILLVAAVFLNQTVALKALYDQVQAQAEQLEGWNQNLTQRVNEQVDHIERLGRLKRFLSPHVAELVTDSGDESLLASHRQNITALFCDLRGFTAFSERIEPEEAMKLLQSYHEELGKLVFKFDGTIDHRAGDGLMVIFNDPVPCNAPVSKALSLALAMRARVRELAKDWRRRGYELGFGIGIASGYATLGLVGFEGRFDYTANGSVVNLAARLCDYAQDDQIIISQNAYADIENLVDAEPLPNVQLKGISVPVRAYGVIGLRQS
jgi:class 3 adenylate cyclase